MTNCKNRKQNYYGLCAACTKFSANFSVASNSDVFFDLLTKYSQKKFPMSFSSFDLNIAQVVYHFVATYKVCIVSIQPCTYSHWPFMILAQCKVSCARGETVQTIHQPTHRQTNTSIRFILVSLVMHNVSDKSAVCIVCSFSQ